jgi:hypothetical protein
MAKGPGIPPPRAISKPCCPQHSGMGPSLCLGKVSYAHHFRLMLSLFIVAVTKYLRVGNSQRIEIYLAQYWTLGPAAAGHFITPGPGITQQDRASTLAQVSLF